MRVITALMSVALTALIASCESQEPASSAEGSASVTVSGPDAAASSAGVPGSAGAPSAAPATAQPSAVPPAPSPFALTPSTTELPSGFRVSAELPRGWMLGSDVDGKDDTVILTYVRTNPDAVVRVHRVDKNAYDPEKEREACLARWLRWKAHAYRVTIRRFDERADLPCVQLRTGGVKEGAPIEFHCFAAEKDGTKLRFSAEWPMGSDIGASDGIVAVLRSIRARSPAPAGD